MPSFAHAFLLLLALAAPASADELGDALAALRSPEAARRGAGERWLAGHVEPGDLPRLIGSVLEGGAEVRVRIARAVGEADRRLALTSALLVDDRADVRGLGETALRMRVARWNPDVAGRGLTGNDLRYELLDAARRSFPATLRLRLGETLAESCALLARRGTLPIGLSVDPSVASRRARAGRDPSDPIQLVGTWDEIVLALASYYRVGLEGFGLRVGKDGPEPYAFVRFCSPVEEGLRDTGEVVGGWCRTVALGRGEERRAAAARALAGCGFPEGVEWLADRAFVRNDAGDVEIADAAALEGVLAAAAEGRVAPRLARPETIALLVRLAGDERTPESERARSMAIVDALGRLADRTTGEEAVETGPVVLEGWSDADEFGRWVRLAILEGIGANAARTPAREVLADSDAGVGLALQALRTLRAATAGIADPGGVRPAKFEQLLAWPGSVARAAELGELLAGAGIRAGEEQGEGFFAEVTLLVRDLLADEAEPAGRTWRRLARSAPERGDAVARALALARDAGARVELLERAWRHARSDAQGPERAWIDRIAILASLVPDSELDDLARPLLGTPEAPDLAVLGAVAGRSRGGVADAARRRLSELLAVAFAARDSAEEAKPILDAVERAIGDLRSRELLPGGSAGRGVGEGQGVSLADLWRREVRSLLVSHALPRAGRGNRGLAAELGLDWPPPRPPRILDLAALDRRPTGP
ncbi:MAG TPA: hypothetical protein ENJ09_05975 [Planctomycetes bacterium]|nr:hypothetical protein [Planctomycetota bacterium]